MSLITALETMVSRIGALRAALDIRAFFFLGGLGMLGYGLHLYRPWIAFTVCGILLMLTGWLIGDET